MGKSVAGRVFSLFALIAASLAVVGSPIRTGAEALTPNLAPNGSFESDPTLDWEAGGPGTASWVTAPVQSGASAIELSSTGSGATIWRTEIDRVPVIPGEVYRTFAWAQADDVEGRADLQITFFNSSRAFIGGSSAASPARATGTTSDFVELVVASPAPADAAFMRVELRLIGAGTVWFDDVTITDSSAAAVEPLPAPLDLGSSDITDYLSLPGNQVVVVPNGTYSAGDGSERVLSYQDGAHDEVDGEYLGWLVLVAESPHGVVVDLAETVLRLQTPTSRILFVGFSFINGTLEFSSLNGIKFWYSNHEYDPCVWSRKYREQVGVLTSLPDPGPLDPCGTGGGEYSDSVPDSVKRLAVRSIPGGPLPAPLRDFAVSGAVTNLGFFGTDIHNAGDDAYLASSRNVSIAGMRVWDHAEYQGPRLETIDPQVDVFGTGFSDLIHSDALEIARAGSKNWTMTDSWTSRSWFLGGESTNMRFADLWGGGSPFFRSRFLDRASDMPQPIVGLRGFNLGRPTVPAGEFGGSITNLRFVSTTGSVMVLQNLECGVRPYPAPACVNAFAPTFRFSGITQGLPTGITEPTDWFDPQQVEAHLEALRDHPDNPANIWRCENNYGTWGTFAEFGFLPSYLDVPATDGCGAPPPPAQAPTYVHQPSDVARIAGETASFAVIVSGSPTPTLQWRRDGIPIAGATGHEYRIEAVGPGDIDAVFDVVATNAIGSTSSTPAVLSVRSGPTFTTEPPGLVALVAGETATLTVGIAGSPTPSLQWRRNGSPLAGETSAVLHIGPVTDADNGAVFDVVASNTEGTATSGGTELSVALAPQAPTITQQPPATINLSVGESTTLSVVATGFPAPTVQWRRNGAELDGQTSTSLLLGPVTLDASGDVYDIVATNGVGTATSTSAVVVVTEPPDTTSVLFVAGNAGPPNRERGLVTRLAEEGYDVTVVDDDAATVGDAATVDLVIVASSVVPTKIGAMFAESPTPVVTWEPYLYDDFGFAPSSAVGEAAASRRIDIRNPDHPIAAGLTGSPLVLTSANRMSRATVGGDVAIIADVSGSSTAATVFAYEAGAAMHAGAAPARRVGLFPNYSGTFVLNASGRALFDAAVEWALGSPVVVEPPTPSAPMFTTQPVGEIALVSGQSTSVTVAASGSPTPTFQWRRDGAEITGATSPTLTLGPVDLTDDGAVFDVVATNTEGSVVSTAAALTVTEAVGVTVEGLPTVTVVASAGRLDVSWEPVSGASRYQLRYRPAGSSRVWDAPTTSLSRSITGLSSGAIHTVEVRRLSGSSWGPWTTVQIAPD